MNLAPRGKVVVIRAREQRTAFHPKEMWTRLHQRQLLLAILPLEVKLTRNRSSKKPVKASILNVGDTFYCRNIFRPLHVLSTLHNDLLIALQGAALINTCRIVLRCSMNALSFS